jgi:hypothetical protein
MRTSDEVIQLMSFLLEHGAVHIKVGETVEAIFPPPAQVMKDEDALWEDPPQESPLRAWVESPVLPRVK